jgi:antitoxin StbD
MALPDVLPVGQAREALSKVLDAFRRDGRDARPVFFGSRRQAEAVIIPIGLFEEMLPLVEDVLIAREVRARLAADDGTRLSFDELVESVGLDPAQFDV